MSNVESTGRTASGSTARKSARRPITRTANVTSREHQYYEIERVIVSEKKVFSRSIFGNTVIYVIFRLAIHRDTSWLNGRGTQNMKQAGYQKEMSTQKF